MAPPDPVRELRNDLGQLFQHLRSAGVPPKLMASIERKCLNTPRRQTGRVDRRTNRQNRWTLAPDHPDYSTELDARLVQLRLLLDMVGMRNGPQIDMEFASALSRKYFGSAIALEPTTDPLTDEVLGYTELRRDVVEDPKHGYSRFHIGHQDPKTHPKHRPDNVRWQLKTSNDFQGTMAIRVARIAFHIDQFTRTQEPRLIEEATAALEELRRDVLDDPG